MVYPDQDGDVMSSPDVVVIGGGWAGLTAATRLFDVGVDVVLLERSRYLGGRAYSFWDEDFGEWLDNGPHVFIGAYSAALGLLETWGATDGFSFDDGDSIPFIYPGGRTVKLKIGGGGGKLGSIAGLMSFRGMPVGDLLKTVRTANALMMMGNINPQHEPTVADFLLNYGIREGDCGGFWDAVTVAVMNAPTRLAGMKPLIRAMKEGLLIGGKAARIGTMLRPFKQLYIDPAFEYLTTGGVDVRTSVDVRGLIVNRAGRIAGVETSDGRIISDKVISTVPPASLLKLLPDYWRKNDFFSRFENFEYSQIAAVHFTFDKSVMRSRFGFFPAAFTHWVFGRGEGDDGGWSRVSVVISNAPTREEMNNEEMVRWVTTDLQERLPDVKNAEVLHLRVVRTMAATTLLKPGSELIRPQASTPIKGLFLAGDWCGTGLPATIESAVRSGEESVIQIFDQ